MNKKGSFFILLGIAMIISAGALTVYNMHQANQAEINAVETVEYIHQIRPEVEFKFTADIPLHTKEEIMIPDYILNPNMEMPVMNYNGWDYIATLSIPSLDLEIPIISEWSYPALRVAPCRYTGSAYLDNLVIAGHNYSSHFGQLNQLQEGETVILTDNDGYEFTYKVTYREVLMPTAIEEMIFGDWDLTLFTCTVGGKSRVTVRCEKVIE